MQKEMYLYSWSRDEFNYDIVVRLDKNTGKTLVGVRKCDKLMATNERIEDIEKSFLCIVKKYIRLCRGMKLKDAKAKITGMDSFIAVCDMFGNKLVKISTGGRR